MNKIIKIVSFLMVFALLSFCVFIPAYAQSDVIGNYYIKNGGIGDGRSSANPAPDLNSVISSINADGYSVGDKVNVFVMQDDTCNTSGNPHGMAYMMETPATLTAHDATIVVQGYNGNSYLAFSNVLNTQQVLTLSGPIEFKNITIVSPANGQTRSFLNLNAGNIKFLEGTSYGYATGSSTPYGVSDYYKLTVSLSSGINNTTYSDDVNVCFENSFNDSLMIPTYLPRTINYSKDVNITFNNPNIDCELNWKSSNAYGIANIGGNLNLFIESANQITNVSGNGKTVVNGAVQIINCVPSYDLEDSIKDTLQIKNGFWQINNFSGVKNLVSITETPGTYLVKEGYSVTAKDENNNEYISENGVLIIPEGKYSLSYDAVPIVKNYYVKNGGTGNGSSPESPLPTVLDAVNKINDDQLSSSDTACIFVMQREDYDTIINSKHQMTLMGGDMPNHYAKIIITSYGNDVLNLAATDIYSSQYNFNFTGNVELQDINLVLPTNNSFVYCGGNDVTFGKNVTIKYTSANNGKITTSFAGSNSGTSISAFSNSLVFNDNLSVNIKSPLTTPLTLSALVPSRNQTYKKDVNVVIDSSDYSNTVNWAACTTTAYGNFNVNIKNADTIQNNAGAGRLNIKGGLQMIVNSDVNYNGNPMEFSNIVAETGKWLITDCSGIDDAITFTNTAGIFNVKDGVSAIDQNNNVVNPVDGVLSLNEGSYYLTVSQVQTNDYSDYIFSNGGNLKNTYKKLKTDKKLNIVYFGGSVTAGAGSSDSDKYSWRARVGNWFKNSFLGANITNINKACGESGTLLGSYRVARDVISENPDLLFIEYSINDYYAGATYEQASKQFETIVRQVKTALPNCDIVTVFVTDRTLAESARTTSQKEGQLHLQAKAHEEICKAYKLPTIHVGRALADTLPDNWTADDWNNVLAVDVVHPTDAGHQKYFDVIREYLSNTLLYGDYDIGGEEYYLPQMVNDSLFDGNITFIDPSATLISTSESLGGNGFSVYLNHDFIIKGYNNILACGDTGSTLAVKFNGTELVMLEHGTYETFKVKIDNGEFVSKNISAHNPTVIAQGLSSGEHIAYITFAENEDQWHWIGGLYSRDEDKATVKCDYSQIGDKITVYNDMIMDFSAVIPEERKNKVFVGFINSVTNEFVKANEEIKANTVLTAQYVNCNDNEFACVSTDYSLDNDGLRFIFEKTDLFSEVIPNEVEIGAVVLPTDILTGKNLDLSNSEPFSADYSGENPIFVPAEDLYEVTDNSVRYSLLISNIPQDEYNRYFSVKGYVKYIDNNGAVRVKHTDIIRTSAYKVVSNEIALGDTNPMLENIVNYTDNIGIDNIEKIARIGWKVYSSLMPPEQSIPSFKAAYDAGIRTMLCDVRLTADNEFVCLHNDTINSVARNKDGTNIAESIAISDITLQEANNYDFGLYRNQQYKGLTILTVKEFFAFCKEYGVRPHIELKVQLSNELMDEMIELIIDNGFENSIMINGATNMVSYFASKLPNATVGKWVGMITDSLIDEIAGLGETNKKFIYVSNGFASSITEENYLKCLDKGIDIGYTFIGNQTELEDIRSQKVLKYCKYVATYVFDLTN